MSWTGESGTSIVANTQIVDRLELWNADRQNWCETVELSERFHAHLREHAVPLDRRGLARTSLPTVSVSISTRCSPIACPGSNATYTCAG